MFHIRLRFIEAFIEASVEYNKLYGLSRRNIRFSNAADKLEASVIVAAAVGGETSTGARWNDIRHELLTNVGVDVLISWNDGLAIIQGVEPFVATVSRVQSAAPSCRNFLLIFGPDGSVHRTEGLMRSARVPCA